MATGAPGGAAAIYPREHGWTKNVSQLFPDVSGQAVRACSVWVRKLRRAKLLRAWPTLVVLPGSLPLLPSLEFCSFIRRIDDYLRVYIDDYLPPQDDSGGLNRPLRGAHHNIVARWRSWAPPAALLALARIDAS